MSFTAQTSLFYQQFDDFSSNRSVNIADWFIDFLKSPDALNTLSYVLHENRDLNSCRFALHGLRILLNKKLTKKQHASIYSALMIQMERTTLDMDESATLPLCRAVMSLLSQMDSAQHPFENFIKELSSQPEPLLAVLRHFPAEDDYWTPDFIQQVKEATPQMLNFLASSASESHAESVCSCLYSWMSEELLTADVILSSSIGKELIRMLDDDNTSPQVHLQATQCMIAILSDYIAPQDEVLNDSLHLLEFFGGVCSLTKAYQRNIATQCTDRLKNYMEIFVNLCEAFLERMAEDLSSSVLFMESIEILLDCIEHSTPEIVKLTFSTWILVCEEVRLREDPELLESFVAAINRLVAALCRHCREDAHGADFKCGQKRFHDFRTNVSAVLRQAIIIVDANKCFKAVYTMMRTATTWQAAEAALFAMECIGSYVSKDDDYLVFGLLSMIMEAGPEVPHSQRYTSIAVMAEYEHFLHKYPKLLQPAVNFLLRLVRESPKLHAAAGSTLVRVFDGCDEDTRVNYVGDLLGFVRHIDSYQLDQEQLIAVLGLIMYILSGLPDFDAEIAMRKMVNFQLKPLKQLIDNYTGTDENRKLLGFCVRRIVTVLLRNYPIDQSIPADADIMVSDVWTLIPRVVRRVQADTAGMKHVCNLVEATIRLTSFRMLRADWIMKELSWLMTIQYAEHHNESLLRLATLLVTEMCHLEICHKVFMDMLESFYDMVLEKLQAQNGPEDVSTKAMLIEFFDLCHCFPHFLPRPFLRSGLVAKIMKLAFNVCEHGSLLANAAAMNFILFLIHTEECFKTPKTVLAILDQFGLQLLRLAINDFIRFDNDNLLTDAVKLIRKLWLLNPLLFMRCVPVALDAVPRQNELGSDVVTPQRLEELGNTLKHGCNSRNISIMNEMKAFAALYRV